MLAELEVRRAVDVAVFGDGELLARSEAMIAEDAREAVAVIDEVVGLDHQLVVDDRLSASTAVTPGDQSVNTTQYHFTDRAVLFRVLKPLE